MASDPVIAAWLGVGGVRPDRPFGVTADGWVQAAKNGSAQECVELPNWRALGMAAASDGRGGFRTVGGSLKLLKGQITASSLVVVDSL